MMDFEAQGGNEFENADFAQAQGEGPSPVAGVGTRTVLTADGQGVVVLPDGVTLDDIQVQGSDLVVLGGDGTRYVIPDGGIIVPQIEIDGVVVPPANLAALLLGNEPEPAAGPPQSSGGNFADEADPLQDAFGLGDLLPYTELQFGANQDDEIIPDIVDRRPDISIEPGDSGVSVINAVDAVSEAGLPARNGEPAGSDSAADSESTFGFINFSSPDGTSQVAINGVAVAQVGQAFNTPFGVLTITSIADGRIGYSYTLADNTTDSALEDLFTVTITDSDGDTATATLRITIVDDTPTAADDLASQGAEGSPVVVDAFANDIPGADSVNLVSGVSLVDGTLTGAGTVTYNNDGTFTYVPAPAEEGTVTFDYTITDGDGDISTATVTITLAGDSAPTIDVIEAQGGAVVDEAGLPTGSDAAANSETTVGSFAITTGNDALGSLVVNGVDVTNGGTVAGAHGTLTVTFSGGAYSYSYTLTTSTVGDDTQDVFTVTVTDSDGDNASAPLVIDIIDDVPTARADSDSVSGNGSPVADGNVLTGSGGTDANATDGVADTGGADGAVVTTTGSFAGQHGALVLNADGSYTYTLNNADPAVQALSPGKTLTEVFAYTIQDSDGDTSSATLTITINGTNDGVTINGLDAAGAEEVVYEDDLVDGSSPDAAALTQTGTFGFSSPDGLDDVTVGGTQVVTNGVFTAGLTASSALGTVTITGFTPVLGAGGAVIGGTFSYSYTLGDNTLTHSGAGKDGVTDSFAVTVTDTDGSSDTASLDVQVVDDVPTAQADANSVAEGGVVAGNVLGNDEFGADGAAPGGAVTGVAAGSDTSTAIMGGLGGAIAGAYGSLTLNADGSYTYVGTPNTVPPAGATDTFVYTITDGDGDTSTVTLKIDLTDSGPPLAASNEDAVVDEAALAIGSNPPSNAETVTGTLADNVSGGTGPYTFALVGGGGGSHGTLTLDANGNWSYTLATPVDGATADDGTNTVNDAETFTYEVIDDHGNTTTNTLTIDIIDDVPAAADDAVAQAVENAPIVIDALANDVFGADGVATADPANVSVATQPAFGTVTYDPGTGLFTYTPDAGAGSVSTADSFTYTIIDGDGDSSTATVTLTLLPDSQPVVAAVTAAVDDDALGGSALSSSGDIDANAGENPFSLSEAVFNGKIDVDFGADGGSVTLANLDGTPGQVGTEAVTYGWDEGSRTLTATSGRGAVFSVTLEADGTYTVTLLQNVLHAPGGDEANAPAVVLHYLATDSDDGDSDASGTLTITFNDDAPFATDNAATVDEGGSIGGNVLTDGTPDQFGADGPVIPGGGVIGFAQGGTTVAAGGSISTALGTLTLHADGSYSYIADPNTISADAVDVFTYTIEDGDGDRSTATLTINISAATGTVTDDNVLVDEAGLDGTGSVGVGSAAATNSETDTNGAITATGGTPPYSYAITSSPAGPVGTLTLNAVDGTYSYTLNGPIDGPTAADGAQTLLNVESYGYEVRDSNGNVIGTGSIVVDVIDDVPTAHDDAAVSVAEDAAAAVGGNVLTNDTQGADGATVVSVNIGGTDYAVAAAGTTTIPLVNGTYTIQANGAWAFDPNPGLDQSGGPVDASFTYTIEDGDGDRSSAIQPISITDGGGPIAGAKISLAVDDENLADGSSPAIPVTDSGDIVFTAGSDAIDTIAFGMDLSGLDPSLTWTRVDGNTITGSDGGTLIVTLELTRTGDTATVTATLHDNYDSHPGINADDTFPLGSVNVIATDTDGDTATSSVSLSVSDDVPTVSANDTVLLDDDALGGNAGGTDDDADSAFATGTLGHAFGADGGAITFLTTGAPSGFQYVRAGDDLVIQQEQGAGNWVDVVTVTLDTATGAYTVIQNDNILHAPGGDENNQSFTLNYKVEDGDGDTAGGTLTINVDDDTPTANSLAASSGSVDEEGLAGGIDGGTNDLPGTDLTAAGSVTGLFNAGADGPLTYALKADTGSLPSLSSGGTALTYSVAGNVLTASAGGTPVFTFTLDASSGAWTFELEAPLDHAPGDFENVADIAIEFGGLIVATDADGDSVDATGSVVVTIDDDSPLAVDDANSIGEDGTAVGGNVLTDGTADGFGADGPHGTTQISAVSGAAAGTVGGNTAGAYGTLLLNLDGTYSYTLNQAAVQGLDDGETYIDTFTYTIQDVDGDTSTASLKITINGANDAPAANPDTNWVLDVAIGPDPTTSGNVLQNLDHPGAPAGIFADVADTDVDGDALSVTGVTGGTVGGSVAGTYGAIVIGADGNYTYTLDASNPTVDALPAGGTVTDSFTYTVSDGTTTDTATITITIFGTNSAPVVTGSAVAVSEEGLPGGVPDDDPIAPDDADTTDSKTASGSIGITDGDSTTFTVTLGIPMQTLHTPGGVPLAWDVSADGKTLKGYSTDISDPEITVTIDDQGDYTVTLGGPVKHGDTAIEDLASFVIPVSVSDGVATTDLANGITVTIEDDSPTIGAFSPAANTVDNAANETASGTFGYSTGGDGHGSFAITGPAISGISYTLNQLDLDADGEYDAAELVAKAGADTVFKLQVDTDGNYLFTLVTPDAATTENISFAQLSAGGPSFRELEDDPNTAIDETGRVEFTGSGTGVNAQNNAFGVSNPFVDPGESFSMEFHNPGAPGDNGPNDNPEFLTAVDLNVNDLRNSPGNVGPNVTVQWWAQNTLTSETETGFVTITSTGTVHIDPSIVFNKMWVQNINDPSISDDGARFSVSGVTIHKLILPQDQIFDFEVRGIDADGDVTSTSNLTIFIDATPPIALDLDGDGVEFLGLEAGVAHDYGDGLKATAWVSADDGLLARDTGKGLDIVFTDDAPGATSDLDGVRLGYDSDGDGLLTANDNDWGSFGVWQDANSDGKADPGEFISLSDAGISSIGLVSDGQSYNAAGGDVFVKGTASFTRVDGSRGDVTDALFATSAQQKAAQRTAETVVTAAAAGALLMPQPVLAHDQIATADEPLQRIDAGMLDFEAQDVGGIARKIDQAGKLDLLDEAKQVEPESAERTADLPAEDFASTMLEAGPDAHPGSAPLGVASEPVADFGGSAFAGFQSDASGGAIMDALLALQATPPQQQVASADAPANPAVMEALGEVADGAAVDAIVDHYADGENLAPAKWGGEIDSAVLLQALDGHVFAGSGAVIPDAMDDAALLAAAVPA